MLILVRTPKILLFLVWPLSLSLATTRGISVDFFSSPYLDVSVREVPHAYLCIQYAFHGSSPWEFPHSDICGYNAYLQLTAAYRSLSRPSSAPDAKAFTLRSFSLELSCYISIAVLDSLNCLSFIKQIIWFRLLLNSSVKRFYPFAFWISSTFRWNCNLPKLERP